MARKRAEPDYPEIQLTQAALDSTLPRSLVRDLTATGHLYLLAAPNIKGFVMVGTENSARKGTITYLHKSCIVQA